MYAGMYFRVHALLLCGGWGGGYRVTRLHGKCLRRTREIKMQHEHTHLETKPPLMPVLGEP